MLLPFPGEKFSSGAFCPVHIRKNMFICYCNLLMKQKVACKILNVKGESGDVMNQNYCYFDNYDSIRHAPTVFEETVSSR